MLPVEGWGVHPCWATKVPHALQHSQKTRNSPEYSIPNHRHPFLHLWVISLLVPSQISPVLVVIYKALRLFFKRHCLCTFRILFLTWLNYRMTFPSPFIPWRRLHRKLFSQLDSWQSWEWAPSQPLTSLSWVFFVLMKTVLPFPPT